LTIVLTFVVFVAAGVDAMAYESMYQRTPVGKIEIKTLPAARAIATKMEPRRENTDSSFMQLFRFVQTNAIPMTIPVETDRERREVIRA
jgi:hypothetical protein